MLFDSMEYRRQFWRESYRHGHTIGHMPRTAVEFTDPHRHPYNEWIAHLLFLMMAMGVSAVVWWLVRAVDSHVRRLRRPTYYEVERERRLALAEERRRIRKRRTTSPCPTPDMLRTAFAQTRASTASMIRFGSMLEDLECYVDNSVVWSETEGRIVGRRGGIRQWLRDNVPDLSGRYKTMMKYKALAKRFRQAVGVSDPVPATAVLPSELSETQEGNREARERELCSEQILVGQGKFGRRNAGHSDERKKMAARQGNASEKIARSPEEIAIRILAACEGTMVSLSAQIALMVSADFVPDENIDRTNIISIDGSIRSSA